MQQDRKIPPADMISFVSEANRNILSAGGILLSPNTFWRAHQSFCIRNLDTANVNCYNKRYGKKKVVKNTAKCRIHKDGADMNRIAIVEDDQGYRDTLFTYIKQYEQERDTAFEATPFEKADDFLAVYNGDYDIILMDIEMPGTNGMDAAEQIRKKDAQVVIMFITNMAHYAIKGYEVGALDFVLKPIQYLNFANKMDRAMQLVENRGSKPVMIQTGTGVKKIDSRDIFYVEIQNHVLRYHTKQGNFEVRGSLKNVEEELPKGLFAKCSNWCLVGLTHVAEIKDDTVIVEGEELQISRRSKKNFMTALIRSVGRS